MTTVQLKTSFHQLIDGIKDNDRLKTAYELVAGYLFKDQEVEWKNIPADLKEALEEGIHQANKGKLTPYDKVKKNIKKRFNS
jgi:hypothetical protein